MKIVDILNNSKLIFIIAIVFAFVFPHFASNLKPFIVPILMLMMTISIKNVGFHHVKKHHIKDVFYLLLTNYVLYMGLFLLMVFLFIKNPLYQKALYVSAIMPPAIGIISMTYILKGDMEISFITEFLGYVLGIILIPILSLFLFGSAVSPWKMLEVLFYVVIIPFILSRFIHYFENKYKKIGKKASNSIINLCYFFSFYVMIGLNREVFFNQFSSLIPILLVMVCLRFGLGTAIFLVLKSRMPKKYDVLYVLFGSFKNGGAAMAICLLLFGVESTVPFAVGAIVAPVYILYLEWFILTKFK